MQTFLSSLGATSMPFAAALLEDSLIMLLLIAAAVVDARRRVIPDGISVGIVAVHVLAIALASAAGVDALPLVGAAAVGGAAIGGGLLLFTLVYERLVQPGAFGGGDIKLMAALGFSLGWERSLAVLLGACIVFAGWMGARLLLAHVHGREALHNGPFAPALALSAFALLTTGM